MIKKFVLGLLILSFLSVPLALASENLFQFQAPDIDGEKLSLRQFEGQVVLVVNTASKCGYTCLLYTSPSPRDPKTSRMPSSA